MNLTDILIIVVAVLILAFGLGHNYLKRKKAKETGANDCAGCSANCNMRKD